MVSLGVKPKLLTTDPRPEHPGRIPPCALPQPRLPAPSLGLRAFTHASAPVWNTSHSSRLDGFYSPLDIQLELSPPPGSLPLPFPLPRLGETSCPEPLYSEH